MSSMQERKFKIEGMDCADCAARLERGVGQLEGVQQCFVHFGTATMVLVYDPKVVDEEQIHARVQDMGYEVATTEEPAVEPSAGIRGFWQFVRRRRQNMITLLTGALIALAFLLGQAGVPETGVHALYGLAVLAGGHTIARKGLKRLLISHEMDIHFLMGVAALGAIVIGAWEEGALVVFLFSLGETLESYTLERARDSIRRLMELAPAEATLLENGSEKRVPVAALQIGQRILVRPGERIPMDGRVVRGRSAVNQAPITGESIPVPKELGDEVYAGTVNQSGALEVVITRRAEDNTISRIIQMVEEAQAQKAPTQQWVDTFARYYTPAVVGLAVLIAIVPPLLLGQPFLEPAGGGHGWLYRALALLVIACPCALVISTPVSVVSAISAAARHGVLVKGGAYLEAAGALKVIAFDKTGTLTLGRPVVTKILCADGCCLDIRAENGEITECEDCNEVLALAAAVESRSEHPLAQAITEAAAGQGLDQVFEAADEVTAMAGRGVYGRVNGQRITVGSHRHFDQVYPHDSGLCEQIEALESDGQTTMLVHDGAVVRGYIAVADQVRPGMAETIAGLHRLGIERIVMLTGDNRNTAEAIAAAIGVDEVRANLLPEEKVEAIKELVQKYGQVAMVGDGVNDAPALAMATVGIAMGGAGTDQALETADIILMADDLSQLPFVIRLSRRTRQIIRQNVVLSLLIKGVFMALAIPGWATLWMAVFADVGASLLVILNGMRLLRD